MIYALWCAFTKEIHHRKLKICVARVAFYHFIQSFDKMKAFLIDSLKFWLVKASINALLCIQSFNLKLSPFDNAQRLTI